MSRKPPDWAQVRYRLRRTHDRLDDPVVRAARQTIRRMSASPRPEVLFFGESTAGWVAPEDRDRRKLFEMAADLLGKDRPTHAVHGGSYNTELVLTFVHLLRPYRDVRPVVVVPLWVRGRLDAWRQHPVWGRQHALEVLRRLPERVPARRVRAGQVRPTPADFDAYQALPHETILGPGVVGDYTLPLRDPEAFADRPRERERLLYAFHHSAELRPGSTALEEVRSLAAELAELDWPFVCYQTPISVQTGTQHLGPEFATRVERNFDLMAQAVRAGAGREVPIVESGTTFPPELFIDPALADEHLNQVGRLRLAAGIADAVEGELRGR